MTQNIQIKSDGGAFTKIYIDGHEIKGVRSWHLSHGAGYIPILKLDLNALNLDVDSKVLMYDRNSMQGFDIVWRDDDIVESDTKTVSGDDC